MSDTKTGIAFLIAILAAMVLPCAGTAQMQTGTQESTSTTPSSTDTTPTPSASSPAGTSGNATSPAAENGETSSWTAGKANFGFIGLTPALSSGGATSGSWAAGSSSFGIKKQSGTTWRESGGGSMGNPSIAHTQSSAAEDFAPAALPGSPFEAPATIGVHAGARSGAHPVSGPRFGASSGARTHSFKSLGSKPAEQGARGHADSSRGFGAGSSSPPAKTQAPSAFAPTPPSTTDGKQ